MRKRSTKLTIKDIAQMCKVSTQTVSRVINNKPDVSEETRQAVQSAIATMGYQPSMIARGLVQQRSNTIGVILAGLRYIGVSQVLNGIAEECENSGYALLVKELPSFNTSNIVPVIEFLMAHQVEGILFAAPEVGENVAQMQSQLPNFCPPIIFLRSKVNTKYPSILVDNFGGAYNAVKYLVSIGRRNIGHISGPVDWSESVARKNGWDAALRNSGLDPRPEYYANGNWSSSSGHSAFGDLIQKYPQMDAVFVANDQMALGVLHYCQKLGKRVPEDMAIIGFDNITEGEFFCPSLSTVTHPMRELGNRGVKSLIDQINGVTLSELDKHVVLPTQLILRDSTPR